MLLKIDGLQDIAETKHPDIICIAESWLCKEILYHELTIYNYQLARLDQNRHIGGILICQLILHLFSLYCFSGRNLRYSCKFL